MDFLIKAQEHEAIRTRPVAPARCAEDSHSSGLCLAWQEALLTAGRNQTLAMG